MGHSRGPVYDVPSLMEGPHFAARQVATGRADEWPHVQFPSSGKTPRVEPAQLLGCHCSSGGCSKQCWGRACDIDPSRVLIAKVNCVYYCRVAGRPKVREQRLDEDAVVEAALKIAQHRLADLTMRSLSTELQVSPGALYRHVASRDELVYLVVEKILGQAPPISVETGDGWDALRAQVLGMQELVDRYPGLDQVVVAHSPDSPQANLMRSRGIEALVAEGLTRDEALYVYRSVTYLWLGSRVAVRGRDRNKRDIATFTSALDILLTGLRSELGRETSQEVGQR